MKIDLTKLLNSFIEEVTFEDFIIFDESYIEKSEIKELKDVFVKGSIKKNSNDLYSLDINVTGIMVLPCSISLENVDVPFNININEVLNETSDFEEYIKINDKYIDIIPIVWQNIVMEIPLKVVSPNLNRELFNGDGWRLLTEDDINKEEV